MQLESLIIILAIGAFAGWLAGIIMKGRGFGVRGALNTATIGAVIFLFLAGLIRKV